MISQVSFSGNIIIGGTEKPINEIEVKGANILCLGDKTKVKPDELIVGDIFVRMTKGEKENSADEIEQCLVIAKENNTLSYLKLVDSYTRNMSSDELSNEKSRYHKNGCINVYA